MPFIYLFSVTIKDLNVVALRNGYRIFLKHIYTFVIRRYINTVCSGGDLGSWKAALPIAGERGWRAKYQKYAAYLKSWRPSSQWRWVRMVVSYCSNIPSTWQRHQVLSNLQVFCSAKVLYTVCVCVCGSSVFSYKYYVHACVSFARQPWTVVFTEEEPQTCVLRVTGRRCQKCSNGRRQRNGEAGEVGFFSDFNDVDGRHRRMKLQQTNKGRNPYFILFSRNNEKFSF